MKMINEKTEKLKNEKMPKRSEKGQFQVRSEIRSPAPGAHYA